MRLPLFVLSILVLWVCLSGWLVSGDKVLSRLAVRQSNLATQLVREIRAISTKTIGVEELGQLLEVSNVQEIIWRLQEAGDSEAAAKLYQLISDQLQQREVVSIVELARGSSKPQLVELAGGLRAIFKSDAISVDVEREVLLHKIDAAIGTNIVPITVVRTINGKVGSLQLFIENSLAADELSTRRLQAVGFESTRVELGSHHLSAALTPERSPAAKTLQLLTVEGDSDNAGNYLLPKLGRQIAIDGTYAFDVAEFAAEHLIKALQRDSATFLLDERIATKLEAILNDDDHPILHAIRALDADDDEMLAYDDLIDHHAVEQNMRLALAAYTDVLRRPKQQLLLNEHSKQIKLVELLSAREWEVANDLLANHHDLRTHFDTFVPALQELALRKHDHELLKWVHANAPNEALPLSKHAVVNYAIHAEAFSFARQLKAMGFESDAPRSVAARQASIHHAFSFGALKTASRLMDNLNDYRDRDFLVSLLTVEALATDVRKQKWLRKYEDIFQRQLLDDERVLNLLATQIRHYLMVESTASVQGMRMVAFLARIPRQLSASNILKSFGKNDKAFLIMKHSQAEQRVNVVAEVLHQNGMPKVEAQALANKLKTAVAKTYDGADDLNKMLESLLAVLNK